MMPDYELKVGICGCTSQYTGKLEGQTIQIASLRKYPLSQPVTLNLLEVPISEEVDRKQALRDANCHLFLDVGEILPDGMRETELIRFWIADYGAGHGENRLGTRTRRDKGFLNDTEEWFGKRIPSTDVILRGASRVVGTMSPIRFTLWINNLPEPTLRSF